MFFKKNEENIIELRISTLFCKMFGFLYGWRGRVGAPVRGGCLFLTGWVSLWVLFVPMFGAFL